MAGLWGIIRAYAQPRRSLPPLCGKREEKLCLTPPPGACVRKFEIAAIQMDLEYNRYGDHDPAGLLFVRWRMWKTSAGAESGLSR